MPLPRTHDGHPCRYQYEVGCFDMDHDGVCNVYGRRADCTWIKRGECRCPPPNRCPTIAHALHHGYEDLPASGTLPTNVRVFYPTTSREPLNATATGSCEDYALILFVHGSCGVPDANHYRRWSALPAHLAQHGFVVAVPSFGSGPDPFGDSDVNKASEVLAWMKSSWSKRAILSDKIGIIGHSYGAIVGGRLNASGIGQAYVSLSGGWIGYVGTEPSPLGSLSGASLFAWGGSPWESSFAALTGGAALLWDSVPEPKHRLIFNEGEHWDYLAPDEGRCSGGDRGPCYSTVGALTREFVTAFLSRYVAPVRHDGTAPITVAPSLLYPDAHDHAPLPSGCKAQIAWDVGIPNGSIVLD